MAHGPAWSPDGAGRITSRYPLAVERHMLRQVGHLMPGITTVTAHARYYVLHGLVAIAAQERDLSGADARMLLRRAEVVMAGVSRTHRADHLGYASPHGGGKVARSMDRHAGDLHVDELAADGVYAKAAWGFWNPYLAPEATLDLVQWSRRGPVPGGRLDARAVSDTLGDLLRLADKDLLTSTELEAHEHLCMCAIAGARDGEVLQRALLPDAVDPMSPDDRRRQSLRLILRLAALEQDLGGSRAPGDLRRLLLFEPSVKEDEVVRGLDAHPAWVGVALRGYSVEAWRDLWAWLVKQIDGFMPVSALGEVFADHLPAGTVSEYVTGLPSISESGRLLPAEIDVRGGYREWPDTLLAQIVLGSLRIGTLDERAAPYYEGHDEGMQELTPSWVRDQIEEWSDRPLRDFGIHLARRLVDRSQRLALMKSTFDMGSGRFRVPTRVFVREGRVYRDSYEAGGGVSLRWGSALRIMGALGLLEYADGIWNVTDRGRAAW